MGQSFDPMLGGTTPASLYSTFPGQDYSGGGDYQSAPYDPLAPLRAQTEASRSAFMESLLAQGETAPFQMTQPPGMSGLQAGIGGALGLIAAMSGPNGNGPGVAGQYAGRVMDFNTRKWQTAMENMRAQRESEVQRKKLKAQAAQLDYEDKARELGQQVQFRHQDAAAERAFDRQRSIEDMVAERQLAVARERGVLEAKKLQGDPEAILTDRYNRGEITKDEWLNGIAKVGPAKAAETAARTVVLTKQAEAVIARAGLDKAKAAQIREVTKYVRPQAQARVAQMMASAERAKAMAAAARDPRAKAASAGNVRATYNSLISTLDDEIKEAQRLLEIGPHGIEGFDHVAELVGRRDQLREELTRFNMEQTGPKAPAPK